LQKRRPKAKYLAVYPASNPTYVTPACELARQTAIVGYLFVPIDADLKLALSLTFSEKNGMEMIAKFLAEWYRQGVWATQ
jgi:hypothetical protein